MSKRPEIIVREAARKINCSERTIINLIKMKRFEAIKVGREWYIDYASFLSFVKRYEYELFEEPQGSEEKKPSLNSVLSESQAVSPELTNNKRKYGNILTLRVYQIFKDIFERGNFKKTLRESPREIKVIGLGEGVLEDLGAGFYGFGAQMKKMHYSKARARLGAIVALLYSDDELKIRWQEEINQIEERLLPAFGALIKKLEQKSYRNRNEELS